MDYLDRNTKKNSILRLFLYFSMDKAILDAVSRQDATKMASQVINTDSITNAEKLSESSSYDYCVCFDERGKFMF